MIMTMSTTENMTSMTMTTLNTCKWSCYKMHVDYSSLFHSINRLVDNSKPKYERVKETDITVEYDRDATYDKNVYKSVRSKRSV